MERPDTRGYRSLSLTTCLIIAIVLITAPIIGLLSYMDYATISEELTAYNAGLQQQTEEIIIQSINTLDTGLKFYDDTLNERMRSGFGPFLEEYERAGRDPAAMDLERVKAEIGGDFDLYIINEDGVVEYTTHEPDLGLDFKEIPYFFEAITELRLGESFSADRVVQELSTGQLRKFAYMPTPDNRYLLELGLVPSAFIEERQGLKYRVIAADLTELNPIVECIRIFNCQGDQVTRISMPDDDQRKEIVQQVYREKTDVWVENRTAGQKTGYIFVDLTDPDYASDLSLIVEITYNTRVLADELRDALISHVMFGLAAIIATCGITFVAARHITRPIREIVEDVDAIARGDLDMQIRTTRVMEFSRLEQSINRLVAMLREKIRKLHESEDTIRNYIERLEYLVEKRTADLKRSSEEANLYLDIMIHDINNANAVSLGYAGMLVELLEGEMRKCADAMLSQIRVSADIIENVSALLRIQETRSPLKPVEIGSVIRAQARRFSAARIPHETSGALVWADDYIPVLFRNLIENSFRYGGPDVLVQIQVEEREDDVIVSIEDTGPGLADVLKEHIFERFRYPGGGKSGMGLGLFICRTLVERYGGRIWADDRVPGSPEMGAAFRFLLLKVQQETAAHPSRHPHDTA
ncbi:osmosensitive k+ channel histidine kinase kdpd [hydrocarbon metagenome]|uniref:histidine kinase n=1 Tax=hydrocarbon metagenome TaxID=938273 RepID=A0A0W8FHJ8_9ZZZZ